MERKAWLCGEGDDEEQGMKLARMGWFGSDLPGLDHMTSRFRSDVEVWVIGSR